MVPVSRRLRPLLSVALPVAIAVVLVCLALVNVASVSTWRGELEDGVLWRTVGANLVAVEVAKDSAGDRAGIQPGDVLLLVDAREVTSAQDVVARVAAREGRSIGYVIQRQSSEQPVAVTLQPMPLTQRGLYYPLALVGIFSLFIGSTVRLRRPSDPATLHFFWLSVAFFGVFAFHASGKFDRLDYFFWWSDVVAALALPPMFLHFALVFPDRPQPWVATDAGRATVPLFYVPAFLLGGARVALMLGAQQGSQSILTFERLERVEYAYLGACLIGGLALMMRALSRLRSITARRQLRWIVWGSAVGAVPFVLVYILPYLWRHGRPIAGTEYTAVLLGCIPLAFASAVVRYRLMDIEVIIKKTLVGAAVVLVLALIYRGVFLVVSMFAGSDPNSRFWALFATLVVALVYPRLKGAVQAALDRVYYRDRYDYRKALVTFARELNSDLDLDRLSTRLVTRVRDTLAVDKIALFLSSTDEGGDFVGVTSLGLEPAVTPRIGRGSSLGARLASHHSVLIDDPLPLRRLSGDEASAWREAGLHYFVPCVAKDVTIGVLALGRKVDAEPLSSEDVALLGAVAGQAATALENARLYGELRIKADEIERLRQFGDSVVESLSDGLLVVDLDDRVMRWNRRLESLIGLERGRAVGRRLPAIFDKVFLDSLYAARRDAPDGVTLYRMSLASSHTTAAKGPLLVNAAIAPLQTTEGVKAGWIIVLEDITDRANLEEQLRLSEKMAAIGLLAAGVAHEVNTPLTGISSFTQMLLERAEPDDPRTQLLEKIERQTFRAAKIVNSLLNLARPTHGETRHVDINAVINDVWSLLEHQFKTSRIQVRKELASPAPIVQGVEYKLQQVFLNLFLNARDAMPKGGWLSVSTRVEGGQAVIELADTGVGIPAEHLARIYDPFFTTKPEGRGTGLGLSVTYGIVQEHGGALSCESVPGQGTRFRLVLPISDQPSLGAATGSAS
jgi:two-component system NtrC family sensor kinase